ncbi:ComEC family competence protein [Reichenbachiella agarivorans]|uniref:ComEC family competence protein n=1 Tax=Reichenbachiella agarivorans TaxID=2979464 RepID=A0ABY6CJR9_9BACT|nr:ComEC/Rec2 family competence protein [Reichenbachiella agarivorans]UXP30732.1 ComEC family competence protein [Reichenbachiella agarivorans]
MFAWSPIPFVRICAVFIIGILAAHQLPDNLVSQLGYLPVCIGLIFLLVILYSIGIKGKSKTGMGITLLILIGLAGTYRYIGHNADDPKARFNAFSKGSYYTAIIQSYPVTKGHYKIYQVESLHIKSDTTVIAHTELVQLYIKTDSTQTIELQYGDLIQIQGLPFEISAPSNPHEFDYANYMALQKIHLQQFISPDQIQVVKHNLGNPVLASIYRLRQHFENQIISSITSPQEQGIALALLLGIKDRLDGEIKSAYAAVGAMHVLAVSGLHVGVIHYLLLLLFRPFKLAFFKQYLLPILSILMLWTYAMLTGFSPSILRAVTMFSLLIYGQSLDRAPNIYNSISVSAFILLLFNPNQIFSVGFQLSYLAVIGIVYLFDKIYSWWSPSTWLWDKIWTITAVSLAAQIATAPISIYYFHQFPNYFLGSNLFVIPAAFIVMSEGIFLFIANSIFPSIWPGLLMEYSIKSLNWVVNQIYQLPGSLKEWLYLSGGQTILVYLAIIFLLVMIANRKFRYLWPFTICIALITTLGCWSIYQQSTKTEVILYHTRENQFIDRVDGLKVNLYAQNSIQNQELLAYQINPNRLQSHLAPVDQAVLINQKTYQIDTGMHALVMHSTRFIFLSKGFDPNSIKLKLRTDYLVVGYDAVHSLETINDYFSYKRIILTHTNKKRNIRDMSKDAIAQDIPLISMEDTYCLIKI